MSLTRRDDTSPCPDKPTAALPTLPSNPAAAACEGGTETQPPSSPVADLKTLATTAATDRVTVLGHEILGELGRGGMGVVYKARHIKLGRLVALKMILIAEHAGPAERARFQTEAEAIARLQHPNFVQIYEVGEHGSQPFFSLEFCAGGSLETKLNGTPLPPKEAARQAETLARAMHAAHEAGIVHRDLKPANVLLATDGTLKITDFGLAKKLDEAGQTATGSVMGTPSYMAPEQASGQSKEIGPRTDVYALGAILYEMLTGRPPFRAASPLDTIMQVVSNEPVLPSRLQSTLPHDLETISLKCLAKEPGKRYANAGDLAEDLRRFLAGEPIIARPTGRSERLVKWIKRRPAIAALSCALLALLLGGTAFSTYLAWWALGERDDAIRARHDADSNRKEADSNRKEVQRRSALTLFLHSLSRSDEDIPEAMFWAAGALKEAVDADNEVIAGWIRQQLAIWAQRVHRLRVVVGHDGQEVSGAAFCAGGKRLVTWGKDAARLRLWDSATGQDLGPWKQDVSPVNVLTVSGDGKTICTGHADGTARLWDAATGMPVGSSLRHAQSVVSVAFSPDGKRVLTGSADQTARLWNATTGEPIGKPLQHKLAVRAVALSRDGKTILTGSDDGTARLWSAATGEPLSPLLEHDNPVTDLALSADGNTLLTQEGVQSGASVVWLWSAPTNPVVVLNRAWAGASARKLSTGLTPWALSPDGQSVLIGSINVVRPGLPNGASPELEWTARLWDMATRGSFGPVLQHQAPHRLSNQGTITTVAFSPNGKIIVTGSEDGTAKLWDKASGKPLGPPLRHEQGTGKGHLRAVAFSPDGKTILTLTQEQVVRLWDVVVDGSFAKPPQFSSNINEEGRISIDGFGIWNAPPGSLPAPLLGEFERTRLWISVITGAELSGDGRGLRTLDALTWKKRRQRLDALGGPPPGY